MNTQVPLQDDVNQPTAPEEARELSPEEKAHQKMKAGIPLTKAEYDLLTKESDGTLVTHHNTKYVVKHGTYYRPKS